MEKTKLLVGGVIAPEGGDSAVTSLSTGAPRDYGGAQQLKKPTSQQLDTEGIETNFLIS